ncbi:hypothetical protein ABTE65_18805, partial [Acinetobacter baumannii]
REVSKARPGETIKISIIRDRKPRVVEIKSGTRPSESSLAVNGDDQDQNSDSATPDKPASQKVDALGLTLSQIDAAARQTYKIDPEIKGL